MNWQLHLVCVTMLSRLEILMWFQLWSKKTHHHLSVEKWLYCTLNFIMLAVFVTAYLTFYWINQPNMLFTHSYDCLFKNHVVFTIKQQKNCSVSFHHWLLIPHWVYSSGSLKQLTRAAVAVRLQNTDKHCLQSSTNMCPQR